MLSTFGEFGQADTPIADKIMHGDPRDPERLHPHGGGHPARHGAQPRRQHGGQPQRHDGDELQGYWDKLSAAGTVTVPMEKQMWGDEFGMCTDQFGIGWLVNITQG